MIDLARVGRDQPAGQYLRRFWQPVYRSEELKTGRPARVQLLGEHFTLYRGESGEAHLLDDRCPHRQTALFLGWVEKDELRCFYHGWKFDPSGQCVEQPAENPAHAARVKIGSYPVREYLGLVFAWLGGGEPPELPRYPELEEPEGDCVLVVNRYPVPCNWFQRYENDLDEVHVEETEYGIFRQGLRKGGGRNHALTGYHFMPNISMVDLVPSPEFAYRTYQVAWRVPVDDESMMTCSVGMRRRGPGDGKMKLAAVPDPDPMKLTEDIMAGRLRIQDVDPAYTGLFILQDNVVLAGQGASTNREKDRLGASDRGVVLLRKIWQRELTALQEGRPLKEWKRPAQKLGELVFAEKETS